MEMDVEEVCSLEELRECALAECSDEQLRSLQSLFAEVLRFHIGQRLSDQVGRAQMDELGQAFETNDDAAALRVMQRASSLDMAELVRREKQRLKALVRKIAMESIK